MNGKWWEGLVERVKVPREPGAPAGQLAVKRTVPGELEGVAVGRRTTRTNVNGRHKRERPYPRARARLVGAE